MQPLSRLVAVAAVVLAVAPWTVGASGAGDTLSQKLGIEAQMDTSDAMWKTRPLAKVVALLKDMQMEIGTESEKDEALYDQTACWCSTNDKSKTQAINDGTQHIADLEATIQELTAKTATLDVEIKTLTEDIAEKTDGLDKATAIREKESAEFHGEERDLVGSITSLKGAIITLSKHNPDAVLVQDTVRHAARVIQRQVQRSGQQDLLVSLLNPDQQEAFTSLLELGTRHERRHVRPSDFISLLQDPYAEFAQQDSQQPASGQIFGVLKQMRETFGANLANSQKVEAEAQETFAALKAAKESELLAANKMLEEKSSDLASSNEQKAQASGDYEDTQDGLAADQEFLTNLKLKCAAADHEWEERRKTRQEEVTAVGETIEILTNDESKELMDKSLGGFVQVASRTRRAATRRVAFRLRAAGQMQDPQLAALAESMRLDTFVVVKKSLDKLGANLKREQLDEVKQKDFCTQSLHENNMEADVANDRKMDLTTKMDDMKASIKTLNEEILGLKAEITDMQLELQRANTARNEENKEFQLTIMDQRATQDVLRKAMTRLKEFYDKKLALFQRDQWEQTLRGGQTPDQPDDYQKNSAANGVLTMLDTIFRDSKAMEKDAIQAENDATTTYMSFVKDTNAAIEAKAGSITDKLETRARLDATLTTTGGDLKHTLADLANLASYAEQLHQSCDFLLQNFEVRQASRAEEVEALSQAEGVFAGADAR